MRTAFGPWWRALALVPALAGGALAGPVLAPGGGVGSLRAGVFCQFPPDARDDAPDATDGKLNVYNDPFHFALAGDRAAIQPDIGIGVVAWLDRFRAGEPLRVHVDPPGMPSEEWDAAPDAQGRVWFGYLGPGDARFAAGTWHFELRRRGALLMSYDFAVTLDGPKIDCKAPVA